MADTFRDSKFYIYFHVMDIKQELLADRSKQNINRLADYIGNDKKRCATLWKLIRYGEAPLPQRGAWLFETCVPRHPEIALPYLDEMFDHIQQDVPDGVRRSFSKVFSVAEVPEELAGKLYDLCVDWIMQEKTSIAVKVHCMSTAVKIAMPYPELREELTIVIRDQMAYTESGGIRSRGKRLLRTLSTRLKDR